LQNYIFARDTRFSWESEEMSILFFLSFFKIFLWANVARGNGSDAAGLATTDDEFENEEGYC